MGKVSYKVLVQTDRGKAYLPVEGWEVDGIEGRGTYAVDKRGQGWMVTELSTGLLVCTGRTKEEACEKVRRMVGTEEGLWAMKELIARKQKEVLER